MMHSLSALLLVMATLLGGLTAQGAQAPPINGSYTVLTADGQPPISNSTITLTIVSTSVGVHAGVVTITKDGVTTRLPDEDMVITGLGPQYAWTNAKGNIGSITSLGEADWSSVVGSGPKKGLERRLQRN